MSTHPTLTLDLVRPVVDEIVKDHPERVVSVCKYGHPKFEAPSCLVGTVLYSLGWTYDELREFDALYETDPGSGIETVIKLGHVSADSETELYLVALQMYQDHGYSWLTAYRQAEGV